MFEIEMLSIDLVPTDGICLNFEKLMWSSTQDFVGLPGPACLWVSHLDSLLTHFSCLLSLVSCLGLWKLRMPSQEAMDKKFHVVGVKPFISIMAPISVGGRASWRLGPEKLLQIHGVSPTDLCLLACFHQVVFFNYYLNFFYTYKNPSPQFAKWWFVCI